MAKERDIFDDAHDALNRMRRAYERRTGCHLTAEMVEALGETSVGSLFLDDDPRKNAADGEGAARSKEGT